VGKQEKIEVLYQYLSGQQFKQRIEAIVESFTFMRTDLDKEKTAMEKIWAKREKQIEQVVKNLAGMHGDLEGIIGSSMPQISIMDLKQIGE
jgi:hypothetical protein